VTTLAERLEREIPEILRLWESRARASVPAARHESRPILLDRLPDFLRDVARALASPDPAGAARPQRFAAEHGKQRAELTDYSLAQVVREYSLLRAALLEVLGPVNPSELRIILDLIDAAVAQATTEYVAWQSVALRESEERFRLLVENVKDYAIFMLDPAGHVITWNQGAERITGYESDDVQGRHLSTFYSETERAQDVAAKDLETAALNDRLVTEGTRVRKNGTSFLAHVVITTVRDQDGSLLGFSHVTRDVTERHALEAEIKRRADALAEVNRRKDEFLAVLSHELRNPLAPIISSVALLRRKGARDEDEVQAVEIIDRQAGHLNRLVDDLLDVARITRGKIALRKEPVELMQILAQVAEGVRPFTSDRRQTLSLSLLRDSIWLQGDPTRLSQVFANLLHNSIKFTERGGNITLRAWVERSEVCVEVCDTGVGIEAHALRNIFDMFIQGEQPLDRLVTGLGIGLALVRSLVEMHDGSVTAFSEGAGKGSRFVVRLPIHHVESRSAPTPAPTRTYASARVLVVDDNVDAATSMAKLLELCGHTVRVIHDGKEALDVAIADRPDVIVLDIGLPGMDGYEVARAAREHSALKSVTLIALSGLGRDEDKQRSREAGFDVHLTKPADLEALQEAIAGHETN
jgi:PAS domain S-box-containing protein